MEIQINGKDVEIKNTIRAFILYENITGTTFFAPSTLEDILTYFYCVVVTSAKDYSITFENFLDYIDEHPNAIKEFTEWAQTQGEQTEALKKN